MLLTRRASAQQGRGETPRRDEPRKPLYRRQRRFVLKTLIWASRHTKHTQKEKDGTEAPSAVHSDRS